MLRALTTIGANMVGDTTVVGGMAMAVGDAVMAGDAAMAGDVAMAGGEAMAGAAGVDIHVGTITTATTTITGGKRQAS